MHRYGGIDLHSNNSVVALLDEDERLLYRSVQIRGHLPYRLR
jgi:hypothetical protein